MNDSRRQHLSVAQAASALEAVAAAANALARGSELPSLLQFQGMVQNHSNNGAGGGSGNGNILSHGSGGGDGGGGGGGGGLTSNLNVGNQNDGDGGLSELRSRLNNAPTVDPQHIARSLEEAILTGSALLEEDFLENIVADEGRLRDSLSHSAGSITTLMEDENVVRYQDKTYPAWPVKKTPTTNNKGKNTIITNDHGNGNSSNSSSKEMQTHLRNLNVTIAALGLGLAVANDEDNEHSVRSYGAKVSNCEMKEQETLQHADLQNSLITLAAKSFHKRMCGVKQVDAVAPVVATSRKSNNGNHHGEVKERTREEQKEEGGWLARRRRKRKRRRGSTTSTTSTTSTNYSDKNTSDFVRRVFETQFLELCSRDPEEASIILSEFSDNMQKQLMLPIFRYLRPISLSQKQFSCNHDGSVTTNPWQTPVDSTTGSTSGGSNKTGGGSHGMNNHSIFWTLNEYLEKCKSNRERMMKGDDVATRNDKDGINFDVELGQEAIIAMVTCAIYEKSVVQLTQISKLLFEPSIGALLLTEEVFLHVSADMLVLGVYNYLFMHVLIYYVTTSFLSRFSFFSYNQRLMSLEMPQLNQDWLYLSVHDGLQVYQCLEKFH
jgi:hypothetical protein